MNTAFVLALLNAVTFAQLSPLSPTDLTAACQCPQVKCPAYDIASLCRCLNSREQACQRQCPAYKPTYLACPISPTPTTSILLPPQPTANAPCECESVFCAQVWPDSCYCANAGKQACYQKCGGVKPLLQSCPAYESTSLTSLPTITPLPSTYQPTSIYLPTIKTTKTTTPAYPVPTHARCGGGRLNSFQCASGFICMDDPFSSSCGLACDGTGICVDPTICGGFAGFPCKFKGQMCMDNPTDDCDPANGDNDCAGVCIWPHKDGYGYDGKPL